MTLNLLPDGTQQLADGRRVIIFRNTARWDYRTYTVDVESKRKALIAHLEAMAGFQKRHPGSFTPFPGRELIWREYEPQAWVSDRSGAVGETRPVCEWISELVLDDLTTPERRSAPEGATSASSGRLEG